MTSTRYLKNVKSNNEQKTLNISFDLFKIPLKTIKHCLNLSVEPIHKKLNVFQYKEQDVFLLNSLFRESCKYSLQ